ncbi:hypothetical protein BGZ60DRAFT_166223 [Tricladium varicosporioides]|nr:hypothetical protein BGZ60DRAFT_166223 [Hymenoscyphus varicosporioides]
MPSRRKSAPASRVYKSAAHKQQTKLTKAKKNVRTYGKKASGPKVDRKDNTLTQMDFVKMQQIAQEQEGQEDDSDYDQQGEKRKKRRKTMVDTPEEEESRIRYHTQTISQVLDHSLDGTPQGGGLYDGPNSSQLVRAAAALSGLQNRNTSRTTRSRVAIQIPSEEMPPPQTPRRILPQEIPSSQSPATPDSIHSQISRRSPLKQVSINTPIPFNANRRSGPSPSKQPKLEIRDTYGTESDISQQNNAASTPGRRSSHASPGKNVRFAIPEIKDGLGGCAVGWPLMRPEGSIPPSQDHPVKKITRIEILDSDAESEEEIELEIEAPTNNIYQMKDDAKADLEELSEGKSQDETEPEPETCYGGDFGFETQVAVEDIMDTSIGTFNSTTRESSIAIDYGEATVSNKTHLHSSPSQHENPNITTAQHRLKEELIIETPAKRARYMESQRLDTQHLAVMAPRTAESDIFISVHPSQVKDIIEGTRDHITRNWAMAPTVSRVWIYETAPVSTLVYMAAISAAKRPGEVKSESGKGNIDFNTKDDASGWRAYEILEIYELADPLPLSELISNAWLHAAPSKFKKVPPAVLDQLMANLKPRLVGPEYPEESPQSSATDTQNASAQLISNLRQFTQVENAPPVSSSPQAEVAMPSSPPLLRVAPVPSQRVKFESQSQFIPDIYEFQEEPEEEVEERVPSSQQEHSSPSPRKRRYPALSQATTVDLSQHSTPRQASLPEIVWESPSHPIPTSTPLKLPTPHAHETKDVQESLVPFSMASSQLLTKSQMFPDDLLGESLPGPPPFVLDSDEEDEEI